MPVLAQPPRSTALSEFAAIATSFCRLVEADGDGDPEARLHDLHLLLTRLYLGGLLLPEPFALLTSQQLEGDTPTPPTRGIGDHAAVVARLGHWFGDHDFYREVFDPYAPETDTEVIGSLTDDIADIYGDVRRGLDLWNTGEHGHALFEWRFNFQCHWSEHATGALRALFARSAWHDLGWRPGSAP